MSDSEDLKKEIASLHRMTSRTRDQFLGAELRTCFTALDIARFELSIGHTEIAQNEIPAVEKGIRTIERFLSEAETEQKRELEASFAELKRRFDEIKAAVRRES